MPFLIVIAMSLVTGAAGAAMSSPWERSTAFWTWFLIPAVGGGLFMLLGA